MATAATTTRAPEDPRRALRAMQVLPTVWHPLERAQVKVKVKETRDPEDLDPRVKAKEDRVVTRVLAVLDKDKAKARAARARVKAKAVRDQGIGDPVKDKEDRVAIGDPGPRARARTRAKAKAKAKPKPRPRPRPNPQLREDR